IHHMADTGSGARQLATSWPNDSLHNDRAADGQTIAAAADAPFLHFVAGTLIHTADGLLPVEDLLPGDLVLTADHGFCPLRWISRRRVAGYGPAAPVLITAGTLGNSRDLRLSQHHRVMLSDCHADVLFGTAEVLVAALHLVNGSTIRLTPRARVDYVHLLFDQHELIFSEGILTESCHPDAHGLSRLPQSTRDEGLTLFPDLAAGPAAYGPAARPCLAAGQARSLRAIGPQTMVNAR
ncbi:MAG: Hint domain-containing protein, partial [Pseudorhodobacter sp.]|nr:Hint domain-containing protein [Pseudorhodobacter sp.]